MLTGYLCCVLLKQEDVSKMEELIYASVLDREQLSLKVLCKQLPDWINN